MNLVFVNWEYPGRAMEELSVYLRDGGKRRKMVCAKE